MWSCEPGLTLGKARRTLSPNKQLQRTVIRRRVRGACASRHCAHAPRITRQRAAAELRRYTARTAYRSGKAVSAFDVTRLRGAGASFPQSLCFRSGVRLVEHFLDADPKGVGDAERERQRRVETPVLDGVDGIARDAHALGELGLTPALFGAKYADAVLHGVVRPHFTTLLSLPRVATR